MYVVHVAVKAVLLYLALGAVASSLLLSSGVFHAAFLVFNIDTNMLLRPAIDRHSLSSLSPQAWRSSVNSEHGYSFGVQLVVMAIDMDEYAHSWRSSLLPLGSRGTRFR